MSVNSTMTLGWYDYAIFAATLFLSTSIGVYFGFFGSKQSTVKEYLLAGKKMGIVPIAVSVAVSHFSGTTIISAPADVSRYGASVWLFVVACMVMAVLATFIYLPVFFKLQAISVYEYLERRFDRRTRMLGFVFYVLAEILMFPIHMYSPALIFATASGTNINLVASVLCVICVFYTTIGGLKTVVYTDLLQFVIIMTSLVTIYVVSLGESGGFLTVWNVALHGQRLQVFNFDPDMTARDSFWGYALGLSLTYTSAIVVHQTGVQKFLALQSFRHCKWSLVHFVVAILFVQTFCVFIGLGIYARYQNCDPLTSKQIRKHDQIVPFYVRELAAKIPGVSGLLIAAICSASLSSVSSNLNALSGVIYNDLVCLFLKREASERRVGMILKLIAFSVGVVCTSLVFVVDSLGELLSIALLVSAMAKGPLLGVFTLGVLFPKANAQGAFFGTITSFVLSLGLIIPSKYYQLIGAIKYPTKPLSVSGCNFINQTLLTNMTFTTQKPILNKTTSFQPFAIFKTSFYYYTLIIALMTIIAGLLISYFTKSGNPVDKDLLSPVCQFRQTRRFDKISYSGVRAKLQASAESQSV